MQADACPGAAAAVEDWDLMFDAVKARLRAAVTSGDPSNAMAGTVLECVGALDLLHQMLEQQRSRI
ncbi:hypothetical protein [Roseateles toxinivorans]|nr:hypothetical protein [Roseateles toxinivorans]